MAAVTKSAIVRELRRLGLKEGDVVTCHSSLSSFGRVVGGAKAVVDALLEVVGPQGTLLMPTLVRDRPYDYRKSPSVVGAITEEFRRRPGVKRSLNPCVPAAALGPRAEEFTAGHHRAVSPYLGSPYDLAAKAGGYVLLLGVDQDRSTTLHCAEAAARAPYLGATEMPYVGHDGKLHVYRGLLAAGPHRDFIGAEPKMRAAGIIRYGRIGNCVVRLMKAQEMIDFCVAEIRKDATFFLTKNDGYWGGVWQRGVVRAQRIASQESFKLIARTSSAGRNMSEVFFHARRAGVSGLELDVANGGGCTTFTHEDLAAVRKGLAEHKLAVSVVRCEAQFDGAFEAAIRVGKALNARAVLCPLTGSPRLLRHRAAEAKRARMRALFENVAISSKAAAELLKESRADAALAFNPAHFAAAGELPFLQAFKNVKRFVRYLAITDARPNGEPCLPGNGNGEVKELISILRCSSFNGWFSLGAALSARLPFDGVADAFYSLLDAC